MDVPRTVPVKTKASAEDRAFVGLIYRAMRMVAAAIKQRYGISISVEMAG
jgi:hypothetical protein